MESSHPNVAPGVLNNPTRFEGDPASFTDLRLPPIIATSTADIVQDFFEPLLLRSVSYDRGVGFFSVGWLRINAIGLAGLVRNGGKARWVTSPLLSREEWDALGKGSGGTKKSALEASLNRSLDDLEVSLTTDTLSTLAWMVADEILEFRFAIPTDSLDGEFHDKFGIFTDVNGNRVSFNGSYNDSIQGTRNYESIKVFGSWNEPTAPMVDADARRFERLWNGEEPNLRLYTLPDAIRLRLQRYRIPGRPYAHGTSSLALPPSTRSPLRPYQEEAVTAWESAGRRGVLDMATGTGKTRVALAAAKRTPQLRGLIVGVPSDALITQWQHEIQEEGGFAPSLVIAGGYAAWQDQAFNRLCSTQDSTMDSGRPIVLIGTYHSLAGERFQTILKDAAPHSKSLLFISDEVHRLGAPYFQNAMQDIYGGRLGLTATLSRPFDVEGTAAIEGYFGGTVYRFPFEKAVGSVLCRYDYYVRCAELSEEEFEEYMELTKEIAQKAPEKENSEEYNEGADTEIDRLLFRRANILKQCQDKVRVLEEMVRAVPLERCLIYCADLEQVHSVCTVLQQEKIRYLPYTSQESPARREMALRLLGEQRISAVVAIRCLDEGVDVPEVSQAILLASSTSEREFIQRRGRILRRAPGKERASLVDVLVTPPRRVGANMPRLLLKELRRAVHLARSAENRHIAENELFTHLKSFGISIDQILRE